MDLIASSDPVSEARIRVVMLPARRSHTNDITPTPWSKSMLHEEVTLINSSHRSGGGDGEEAGTTSHYLYLLCVQLHSRYRDPAQEGLPAESTWH